MGVVSHTSTLATRGTLRQANFLEPFHEIQWVNSVATSLKKRQAASSIKIDPNVRCLRIYTVEDNRNSTKTIADLKTVGIKLSREQAVPLARVLLAAAQEWDEIDITAWRVYRRQSDGTYNLMVTAAIPTLDENS